MEYENKILKMKLEFKELESKWYSKEVDYLNQIRELEKK